MSFATRLIEVRKKRGLSQDELAKRLGTKAPVVGRYERDETKPSVEVAANIARELDVSLDYLTGNSNTQLDSSIIERIQDIQQLDPEAQKNVFALLDAFLRDYKTKQAYR